ncbi:major facilitator superfamily transporter domain-containing protein 5 [Coprinopsis cinerea okayama7|uniref:Molybdate-anion transporter n=1 Tax=Coprinopsis cinerea (strain Okayama-7 / 130 / ATCC MYA-4618 / FGSC 9003) TaxID=240176 RepID=D6RPM4_COPC7|nr:major facilitator superfamily transporter domain-containing protein 5 [Coprinopsis cinerea okayama7\|eukprot:XP_002910493.1 major facilitator superfamily transporter domain-containing protein 5 [Coprinopsis cinerea okayama7\
MSSRPRIGPTTFEVQTGFRRRKVGWRSSKSLGRCLAGEEVFGRIWDRNGWALANLVAVYRKLIGNLEGADWLQGPYVYSLYHEQYEIPERTVAVLFVTGFLSAGLAAPFVGAWADQHGRKRLCLAFCVTYTLACLLITLPALPILFLGRIVGGISTSILFSAFESWLVSSASSMKISSGDLSSIMGRASLVNGLVATTAGVISQWLVERTSAKFVAPFLTSAGLLVVAWVLIRGLWGENYGGSGTVAGRGSVDLFQLRKLGEAWHVVRTDPLLLTLGLTQTCFEGSMYLFVFVWVPSLQETTPSSTLPLGLIFSSFMVSMMLGSLLYTAIVSFSSRSKTDPTSTPGSDSSLGVHAKLSSLVCAFGALALAMSVSSRAEHIRFWAFCLFEACVGMYYPVQGMLRGSFISNDHRATVSSLFRIPLNIFVVVSLLSGVSSARRAVMTAIDLRGVRAREWEWEGGGVERDLETIF